MDNSAENSPRENGLTPPAANHDSSENDPGGLTAEEKKFHQDFEKRKMRSDAGSRTEAGRCRAYQRNILKR